MELGHICPWPAVQLQWRRFYRKVRKIKSIFASNVWEFCYALNISIKMRLFRFFLGGLKMRGHLPLWLHESHNRIGHRVTRRQPSRAFLSVENLLNGIQTFFYLSQLIFFAFNAIGDGSQNLIFHVRPKNSSFSSKSLNNRAPRHARKQKIKFFFWFWRKTIDYVNVREKDISRILIFDRQGQVRKLFCIIV